MKRRNLAIIMTLAFAFIVSGCNSSSQPANNTPAASNTNNQAAKSDTVKVGVVAAITGPASGIGKPMGDAAELFKKQLKEKKNKVGNFTLDVLVKDYETNDTNAVTLMKKLISDDKVAAVIGSTQLSTTLATSNIAAENKIPFFAAAPLPKHGDFIFQVNTGDAVVLDKIANYLKKQNIKTVAWISARDAFGQGGLPIFKPLAEKMGIQIVAQEDFDASATDMTVQLTKIKQKNPESIIVWSRDPGASIVSKNYKQLGFKVPMIHSHAVGNESFLKTLGKDGEGIMVVNSKISVLDQLPAAEQEVFKKFAADFQAQYGYTADVFAAQTYDGLNIMVKAIEAGKTTPESINEWLASGGLGEYRGVGGKITFNKDKRIGPDASGIGIMEIHTEGSKTAYRYID